MTARQYLVAMLVALACLPLAAVAEENSSSRPPQAPRSVTPLARAQARYLVLCLDGIGYDLVAEMHRRGELRHFHPPIPLIAPFPTLTNLGLVETLAPLGAPPARGYEDYYFDPAGNRMRGGFFERFRVETFIQGSFREVFDYHPHPIAMTLEYGLPILGAWIEGRLSLRHLKHKFLDSDEPVFLAYLDSTDPSAHLAGKWMLRHFLRRVNRLAGDLQREAGTPIEVVLFSDHGNAFTRWRRANLAKALKRAGFRVKGKLEDDRSVVLPQYGLVSTAVLYTQPGQEAAAAEALTHATGVELALYRSGDAVHVLSATGRARILRRGSRFRYEMQGADPLALASIAAHLPADTEGFIHEDDWLRATSDHIFPDAVRRLWYAFDDLVAQPASVVVSLKDGYYTGSGLLDLVSFLRATHGNLRRAQSVAFAMSTADTLVLPHGADENGNEDGNDHAPTAIRTRDLWPRLRQKREQVWTDLRLPTRRCLTLERTSAEAHSFPATDSP